MMRFSNRIKYGLRFLVFLGMNNESYTDIQKAAISCNLPYKFLEAIAVDLKKHKILKVKRGAGGGYLLNRHPEEISISDIVHALERSSARTGSGEQDILAKVVNETLDTVTAGFLKLMENISLSYIQQKYQENTEKKIMYYI